MDFSVLKKAVQRKFREITSNSYAFRTDTTKDVIWDTYLNSFPDGSNPLFRERTEHDCNCCKQFIRAAGGVVSINADNTLTSIWDVDIGGDYQVVADAMSAYVKSQPIRNMYLSSERKLGTDRNFDTVTSIEWQHFYFMLPPEFVVPKATLGGKLSDLRSNKEVFKRSLDTITSEAIDTVLELIDQNSLYRGVEHRGIVELLRKHKSAYIGVSLRDEDTYCWKAAAVLGGAAKIRNTVIGTLLVDLSEGVSLDAAVRSFEVKVAGENYKRPKALVTQKMIDSAAGTAKERGFEVSLHRRYAVETDVTINNVLFADRTSRVLGNSAFDMLSSEVKTDVSKLGKVEEVDVDTFVKSILPKAESLELLFENRHENSLVSLIAPVYKDSPNILKWDNNFSWSYKGEVADSIKERVRTAGGAVDGYLRCSLAWHNYDDLDIHVIEPNGKHIHFGNKRSCNTGGNLDVDMNVGGNGSRKAVENITWPNKYDMAAGEYSLYIHNYTPRESIDIGFSVEIECEGKLQRFNYDERVVGNVGVAKFNYSAKEGIKVTGELKSASTSNEVWRINTEKFHKVSLVMKSPNHWDDNNTGNEHLFFVLDKCANPGKSRGFYNEFLNNDLNEHRKVFEVLGSKLKTKESTDQLSGLGFSSTNRNSVYCKVKGSFTRIIKINF